ncbi:MAG: MBL fold metallo-hydrolase [Haloarculaceae archaeon]
MSVQLAEDVHWVGACEDADSGRHVHVSVYLVDAGDEYILVDAGPPHETDIGDEVDRLTGGQGVDTLLLTHTNMPHTGHVHEYADRGARVLSATDIPEEFGGYGELWSRDETVELAGREFSFPKPPMTDHVYSLWLYDHDSGVLFSSEALGNYHSPGRCESVWDGPGGEVSRADIGAYVHDRLPWVRYVVPGKLESTLRERLGGYDVSYVAPGHGTPVASDHLDAYLDRLLDVVEEVAEEWTEPAGAGRQ